MARLPLGDDAEPDLENEDGNNPVSLDTKKLHREI
jgi:hypothetical protein